MSIFFLDFGANFKFGRGVIKGYHCRVLLGTAEMAWHVVFNTGNGIGQILPMEYIVRCHLIHGMASGSTYTTHGMADNAFGMSRRHKRKGNYS